MQLQAGNVQCLTAAQYVRMSSEFESSQETICTLESLRHQVGFERWWCHGRML